MAYLADILNYKYCYSVDSVGYSVGICCMWQADIQVTLDVFNKNYFIWNYVAHGSNTKIVCVYEEPVSSKRNLFWYDLLNILSLYTCPMVIVGDFNDISSVTDRWGGCSPTISRLMHFENSLGLINIPFRGPLYT